MGFFYHLGLVTARHPIPFIAFWVALVPLALLFAPRAREVLQPGGFSNPHSQGSQAVRLLHEELGASLSTITIAFHSPTLQVRDPRYSAEMERVLGSLRTHPAVQRVHTWDSTGNERFIASDGRTTYALAGLNLETSQAQRMLPQLKALLPPSELEVLVTGGPAAYADIELVSHRDLARAETISLPLAAVGLVLVFGGVVAAGIPILVGAMSVLFTLALVYFLGQATEVSIFAQNVATMLGLGISIDYALFVVSRYREELTSHPPVVAVARTMATAGRAVFFSGLTVLLGLLGLMTFEYMMLRSIGLAGGLVALVAVTASLTLLPAILCLLGPRINALPLRREGTSGLRVGAGSPGPGRGRGFWRRVAETVTRRPLPVFVGTLILLMLLGLPFLRARLGAPDVTVLPRDVESRRGFDLLRERFGAGEVAPAFVVVEADGPILTREHIGSLYEYTRTVERLPGVLRVESIVNLDPAMGKGQYQLLYSDPARIQDPTARQALGLLAGGSVALVTVVTDYAPVAPEAQDLVRRIRALSPGPGLTSYVGGAAAELMDVVADLYGQFPRALLFIVSSTYLALALQFRSVVLPAKAVLMDALSILASYGALVLIFQDGHLAGLLGFIPEGFVDATVPIVMFCVLFGLSMDYEVFMLSRIKEQYDRLGDNAAAVASGLEQTGRIITSAALIIVAVSGSFALAGIIVIKALGIGMALAIFLDATVVRALLVPATMHLLGRWNWWAPRSLFPLPRGRGQAPS